MLSAAPSDHFSFVMNASAMYIMDMRPGMGVDGRAINRPQVELLATRTSQLPPLARDGLYRGCEACAVRRRYPTGNGRRSWA